MNTKDLCVNCLKVKGSAQVCMYCGLSDTTSPKQLCQLAPRTVLKDRYIIGLAVGMGGFGVTYKAWDLTLNTMVAVKEFFPNGLANRSPGEESIIVYEGKNGEKIEIYKKLLKRFLDEARHMAQFEHHENIVNVLDYFEFNSTGYIVMEYLDGTSVKDYLKQINDIVSPTKAIEIILPVLKALESVHQYGLVHRDVSPDNIIITKEGKIKLIDFGAARLNEGDKEQNLSIIVKPGYAPPEQYRDKSKQGAFTDVYAAGGTLYRILTGKVPEESVDRAVEDKLLPPSSYNVAVSDRLDKIVLRAMAVNPNFRFKNAKEFAEALTNDKIVKTPKEVEKKSKIIRRALVALASLTVVVSAAFLVLAYIEDSSKPQLTPIEQLSDETLTIWVEEENIYVQEAINTAYTDFKETLAEAENQSSLELEMVLIPSAEFETEIINAASTNELPDMYCYKNPIDEIENSAITLDRMINSFANSNYIFMDDDYFTSSLDTIKSIPLSFNIPMVYYNSTVLMDYNVSANSGESRETWDQFFETFGALSNEMTVISPKIYDEILLSQNSIDVNLFDETVTTAADFTDNLSIINNYNPENKDLLELDVYNNLISNNIACVMGTSNDFFSVRSAIPGRFDVSLLPGDNNYVGSYYDFIQITSSSDNKEQMSMWILSYLLSDKVQNELHIKNRRGLPVNKATNNTYFSIYSELDIARTHLNGMDFYNTAQDEIDAIFN